MSNPTPIPGANAATYRFTAEDTGGQVKVEVRFTDDLNGVEMRTSTGVTADPGADLLVIIEADRARATGKLDWVHYTLIRGGDRAVLLSVAVTFEGPAGEDRARMKVLDGLGEEKGKPGRWLIVRLDSPPPGRNAELNRRAVAPEA